MPKFDAFSLSQVDSSKNFRDRIYPEFKSIFTSFINQKFFKEFRIIGIKL